MPDAGFPNSRHPTCRCWKLGAGQGGAGPDRYETITLGRRERGHVLQGMIFPSERIFEMKARLHYSIVHCAFQTFEP